MITFRRIIRGLTAAMPGWLIAVCGLLLIIPLARLAALLLTAALCLIQPVRVRRAVSAWKGGKSHRALDGGAAGSHPVAPTYPLVRAQAQEEE